MPKNASVLKGNFILALCAAFWALGIAAPQEVVSEPPPSQEQPDPIQTGSALPKNADAHYFELSDAQIEDLLTDPQARVEDLFHVPEGLEPMVGFWLKIYAKYSLYQTIVYDRDHPNIVYDVIDTRDLFRKGLSPVALELNSRARIKRSMRGYKSAMQKLAQNPKATFRPGTPGAKLLSLWGRRTPSEWRRIEQAMRTQPGQRDRTIQGLNQADRFFPAMEAIFRKFKIPPQITCLPLVESSFNLNATSKADAVGVWQFLERSAMEYLVVDSRNKIDERLSPIKSAYAAARMFRRNYKLLQDWGLAVIAYNHGAKNLIPIHRRYKGDKIVKLLYSTKHSPLGFASRSYYAEFLAMVHAEAYRDQLYGMKREYHHDAISIVRLKKPASVFEVSAIYNVSIHDLRVFNPDIFDLKRKLPRGTRIVLPVKLGDSLVDSTGPSGERGIASDIEVIELKQ